jgi:hypothetical protein
MCRVSTWDGDYFDELLDVTTTETAALWEWLRLTLW